MNFQSFLPALSKRGNGANASKIALNLPLDCAVDVICSKNGSQSEPNADYQWCISKAF